MYYVMVDIFYLLLLLLIYFIYYVMIITLQYAVKSLKLYLETFKKLFFKKRISIKYNIIGLKFKMHVVT